MSSHTPLLRQTALIQKLQQSNGSTLADLQKHIQHHPQLNGRQYSDRTFERDKAAIRQDLKIEIDCHKSDNTYFIATPPGDLSARMVEAFEVLGVLMGKEKFSIYIHFENRKPRGIQHFQTLLQAIKDQRLVKFKHQKFHEDKATERLVEPYALKEFKGRWYLLAKDRKDGKIKTFGLAQMGQVEDKRKKFEYPEGFDPKVIFKNCFGITTPRDGEDVKEVILSFHLQQGKYVKSYPLHSSQREMESDPDEYKIALNIYVTFDFVMEILSYGEDVEVIMPVSLKNEVKARLLRALKYYG